MKSMNPLLLGTAALACFAVVGSTSANAQLAYGGGSTAAQKVYRYIYDALFTQALGGNGSTSKPLAFNRFPNQNLTGFGGQTLYAGTGSGNGKSAFIANSATVLTAPSNSIPFLDATYQSNIGINATTGAPQYPSFQFAGTDVPWNSADQAVYNNTVAANGFNKGGLKNPANFGGVIQVPTAAFSVGFVYKKDGAGTTLPANLILSRKSMCGIASGHITKWDNASLTADNGKVIGSGQITFEHRSDGSGTSFLLTQALIEQCRTVTGANNETDSTVVSYAFPWTDRNATCPQPAVGSTLGFAQPSDLVNWPDLGTDQCSQAIPFPTGSKWANNNSGGNIATDVINNAGTIGYVSTDNTYLASSSKPYAFAVQNQYDVAHGGTLSTVVLPSATSTAAAVNEINPILSSTVDPIGWGQAGLISNPVTATAYPISGFTWMLFYQCYADHSKILGTLGQTPGTNGGADYVNSFLWARLLLDALYGDARSTTTLNDIQFAAVPYSWIVQIFPLLNSAGPFFAGAQGTACATYTQGAY